MNPQHNECRKCGTCCRNGGPALHTGDLPLIKGGIIPVDRLITIRKGELVNHPLTGKVQTIEYEFVKITGIGRDWCCSYFSERRGCTIYINRPTACRALKCWDPDEVSNLIGKDIVTRFDILAKGNPLRSLAEKHEHICPCPDMGLVIRSLAEDTFTDISALQHLVDIDLDFRNRVVREMKLTLAKELFIFGRPIFQLLQAVGIGISEISGRVRLAAREPVSRRQGTEDGKDRIQAELRQETRRER